AADGNGGSPQGTWGLPPFPLAATNTSIGLCAAGIQAIEVQDRVIDQEIAALCFAAPHWIVGKQNNVAAIDGNINDSGMLRDLTRSVEQAGYKQFLCVGEPKYDSGTKFGGDDGSVIPLLVVRQWQRFPWFSLWCFR